MNMEISVSDYGRMMFELMVGDSPYPMPPHWESIKEKATPLVQALIRLNEEMDNGGYKIHGYLKEGKPILSTYQAIRLAQNQAWGCKASELKKGDYVWLVDNDEYEMYVGQSDPGHVDYVDHEKGLIVVSVDRLTLKLWANELVLKAPEDFGDYHPVHRPHTPDYESDDYWLQKAKELGIL